MSEQIEPGTRVIITDAGGVEYEVEALSRPEKGHKFAIVWVNCPLYAGGWEPTPWPLESVRVAKGQ